MLLPSLGPWEQMQHSSARELRMTVLPLLRWSVISRMQGPLQRGHSLQSPGAPGTGCWHSLVLLSEQRKGKQGLAQRCKEE